MKVLVCNAGSTSLKFKLYDMPECKVMAQGRVERVGSENDAIFEYENTLTGTEVKKQKLDIPDYKVGVEEFLRHLTSKEYGVISDIEEIARVGFKTVLSKNYNGVHELTEDVMDGMKDWLVLAKVHNAAYIKTIEVMRSVLPKALFVGVFEPGFHKDIPMERRIYGLPYEWYEKYGVQRLGYHGASHGYIAGVLNEKSSDGYRAISCHLGGSSSICAIKDGKSVDISFGMSLQSGLIHANRVGDMDCDLYDFLRHEGLSDDEITAGFVKNGGLLGISGVSNDLRYIQEEANNGNERAQLAIDVFVSGIVHYIGSYYVDLEGLDYLVFTAGIGEKSSFVRKSVCDKLAVLGVKIDDEKNDVCSGELDISHSSSKVKVLVIPANEELGIARNTYNYK